MNNRRDFLRRAAALTAGGLASRLAPFTALVPAAAGAQAVSDYKALVCVFLYGGVDGNNLVVPIDSRDPWLKWIPSSLWSRSFQ